jgi:hypothetical protein
MGSGGRSPPSPDASQAGTGVDFVGGGQQSHAHGGQLCPATQAAQAHPQPPPVPPSPGTGLTWTHAPLGQGAVTQTMPSSIQLHEFAPSARHDMASPCPAHGSGVGGAGTPTIVVGVSPDPLPAPTLPVPQAQSQGAQVVPGAQLGQAQVHVPPMVLPAALLPQEPPPPPLQSQLQGGQVSPGAQAGHAQVHVPPPPPPPLGGGFEQSHATAGQSAFAGQAIGCTQVQPPPEASRVWQ